MGKIKKILEKDVGSIGIGAMIIFISMVLVAGIAASVLVQTANRLEMQSMTTGQETEAEVATGIHVIDINGFKNSSSSDDIWLMGITIAPWAGAKEVDLSETYIEISDTVVKNVLKYATYKTEQSTENDGGNFLFSALEYWDSGILFSSKRNKLYVMKYFY